MIMVVPFHSWLQQIRESWIIWQSFSRSRNCRSRKKCSVGHPNKHINQNKFDNVHLEGKNGFHWLLSSYATRLLRYMNCCALSTVSYIFKKFGDLKSIILHHDTVLIGGIVMAKIFGQMFLLALPIKSILGSEYSPQKVASQVEYMLVLSIQRLDIF